MYNMKQTKNYTYIKNNTTKMDLNTKIKRWVWEKHKEPEATYMCLLKSKNLLKSICERRFLNSLAFWAVTSGAPFTFAGSEFHISTTRLEKKFAKDCFSDLRTKSFKPWLHLVLLDRALVKNFSVFRSTSLWTGIICLKIPKVHHLGVRYVIHRSWIIFFLRKYKLNDEN